MWIGTIPLVKAHDWTGGWGRFVSPTESDLVLTEEWPLVVVSLPEQLASENNIHTDKQETAKEKVEVPKTLMAEAKPASKSGEIASKPKFNLIAPADLEESFNKNASSYGIDPGLLKMIAKCESHFNAGANNGIYGGMYQFAASTWASTRKAMGLDPNPDLRFNSEESIKTAAFKIAAGGKSAWASCVSKYEN